MAADSPEDGFIYDREPATGSSSVDFVEEVSRDFDVSEDCFQDFDAASFDLTDDSLSEDEVPDLNEIEFKSGLGKESGGIQYPAILVLGIDTEEEFLFFRNQKTSPGQDKILPLYCMVEENMVRVGNVVFNLQTLLNLEFISQYYKVFLLEQEGKRTEIDVRSPDSLVKYITF